MHYPNEMPFKIAFGVLLVIMGIIRAYFGADLRGYLRTRRLVKRRPAGRRYGEALFFLLGLVMFVVTLLYLFTSRLDPFHIPLPAWLRWTGGLISLLGNLLLWRAHAALGKCWSLLPEILVGQTLVTSGPYRYIRHPMYASWFLMTAGISLLLANWLVAVSYLGNAVLMYCTRATQEEELLIEEFGDEYREYMSRTGRVLPRLRG